MKRNNPRGVKAIADIQSRGRTISVCEAETGDRGAFTFTDSHGRVLMVINKTLGRIGAQGQARGKPARPSGHGDSSDSDEQIINAQSDVLGKRVLAQQGDPSYEKVAGLLRPFGFPYTFLGAREYTRRPSPRIDWDGSIRGCLGFGVNGRPPDWMRGDRWRFKYSLLDGYLPAIQFHYVDEKAQMGWEEMAVAKAFPEYDDALLVFLRFRVRNLSRAPRMETLSLFANHFTQVSGSDHCGQNMDTTILNRSYYPTFTGSTVEQPEFLWVSEEDDCNQGAVYPFGTIDRPLRLRGGEAKSLYAIAAFPHPLKEGTFKRLVPGYNFYRALFEVKSEWDRVLAKGMQVETPEPRVNQACKATLISGFMTVTGSDVKYAAAGVYAKESSQTDLNGLPIAIINAAECFSEWGFRKETQRYLTHFLKHYIKPDGTASYTGGTGGYDYGLLLYAICRCYRLGNHDADWVRRNVVPIRNICRFIIRKRNEGLKSHPAGSPLHGLISMISCDDLRGLGHKFYNYATDACCWLGLREVGAMLVEIGRTESAKPLVAEGKKLIRLGEAYRKDILTSLRTSISHASKPAFVPIYPNKPAPFPRLTLPEPPADLASFANFGFYPFLLYSGMVDADTASAILAYREQRGGEVLGTSRFGSGPPHGERLDDWPIALLGWALVNADRIDKFLLTYYSDMAHLRMPDIFTAYEQVGIKDRGGHSGRGITCGHNICSTLATPRMTKYMLVFEERDQALLWLNRAAPEAWLEDGRRTLVKSAPTRWGNIEYEIESHIRRRYVSARIDFAGRACDELAIHLQLRHPEHRMMRGVTVNDRPWEHWDRDKAIIRLPCPQATTFHIEVHY